MLEFLTSKIPPLIASRRTFSDAFFEQYSDSDEIRLATGFISEDAIVELKRLVEENHRKIYLIIGMHYFEGITHPQYDAVHSLNEYLNNNKLGGIYIVNSLKFHGKVYCFYNNHIPFNSILGSSNLSNLSMSNNNFEVDILSDEVGLLRNLSELIEDLKTKASIDFMHWENVNFLTRNDLLANLDDVFPISSNSLLNIKNNLTNISFEIPLKASENHQKSNLNCFFGKGRVDKKGIIRPRPWYEVELIVPKIVTEENFYPQENVPFRVNTDDGWQFECNVNGDFKKNFRSYKDLTILGKWIKGRLENSGVLKIGERVSEDTLRKYGRDNFTLTKINNSNEWYLDFGRK